MNIVHNTEKRNFQNTHFEYVYIFLVSIKKHQRGILETVKYQKRTYNEIVFFIFHMV